MVKRQVRGAAVSLPLPWRQQMPMQKRRCPDCQIRIDAEGRPTHMHFLASHSRRRRRARHRRTLSLACGSLVQNPLSGAVVEISISESRFRALVQRRHVSTLGLQTATGKIMELLELEPPQYGVRISGIYVIDDDGIATLAGPFGSEPAAIR
jgi:hypothetical protein